MSNENKEPRGGRWWRRYPWRFERWPAWWLIGLQAAALCEWVAGIVIRLVQWIRWLPWICIDSLSEAVSPTISRALLWLKRRYEWNRELFHYAYGVPWRWITDRLWRTPMFDQRPWHCLVCGGEWLPQGDHLSVLVRYGHFEGGTFRPYDEATQVYGQTRRGRGPVRGWWTPYFGGLWWPRPGQASDCVRYVHKWHFVKVDDTAPVLRGKRGRDVQTGELYKRRPVHPWHERVEYGLRWTWAHMRGIAVFALLRFSIAWARFWAKQPFKPLWPWGLWLDGPCRRIVKNGPPWGWSSGRYASRAYTRAGLWWRIRAWWHRVVSFWQRRHAIWAAMPWPWYPVDGDPDGERRRICEHLYYCWQGTSGVDGDGDYFIMGGIDLFPLSVIETDGEPRPTYPGLDMVIDAGNVDGVIPSDDERDAQQRADLAPDDGIQAGQEPSWDDRLVEEGGLPVEIRLVSERQDGKTMTITLGGVEIEVERLEGGALRVKRPGEDDA